MTLRELVQRFKALVDSDLRKANALAAQQAAAEANRAELRSRLAALVPHGSRYTPPVEPVPPTTSPVEPNLTGTPASEEELGTLSSVSNRPYLDMSDDVKTAAQSQQANDTEFESLSPTIDALHGRLKGSWEECYTSMLRKARRIEIHYRLLHKEHQALKARINALSGVAEEVNGHLTNGRMLTAADLVGLLQRVPGQASNEPLRALTL